MIIDDLMPYSQLIGTVLSFSFLIGCYRTMFKNHEKILDKHEQAINAILIRLDHMNGDINYMKGCMQSQVK